MKTFIAVIIETVFMSILAGTGTMLIFGYSEPSISQCVGLIVILLAGAVFSSVFSNVVKLILEMSERD